MRWFWIDRFLEFESGRHAVAIKNVSLAEEHLHDHFPAAPVMPNSLIIEGLAQTGGLLVGEVGHFEQRVVLAKVSKARFHFPAVPGDTLTYRMELQNLTAGGAMAAGTSHVGDRLQGEVEMFFGHAGEDVAGKRLFDPLTLLSMLRMVGLFTVGHAADGGPIAVPPILAEAEAAHGLA